jgi:hypothetical protein
MAAGEPSKASASSADAESEARSLQLLKEFDEKRLATPQDWADMEDFDEDEVIASMTKRVEETWLETQRELQAEKIANGGKSTLFGSALPKYSSTSSMSAGPEPKKELESKGGPTASEQPVDAASESGLKKGDTVRVTGLASRPELNDQVGTVERFNKSKGRFAVRLPDGSSVLLKPHNLAAHDLSEVE